ncbi:hypothetical protein [Streptomyces sp. TLI_55]|uniref:hypothetical protein n=1 Tax=Streptomyces sp. TLI_55 TaxID=1938861 RepID=UPI000BE48ADF|nr:hypothetical protein [Streptomyces sp. TLI_55]
MSVVRWGFGLGATAVFVATGAWVVWPQDVDSDLWQEIRPAIEARLVAEAHGTGYGETAPELDARWFCHAEALELNERDGVVRAGVDTLCMEYGVQAHALVECSGAHVPQVLRLKRDADGGYRIVSQEEPPDGAGYAEWTHTHFGHFTRTELDDTLSTTPLETAARTHFGLAADSSVVRC